MHRVVPFGPGQNLRQHDGPISGCLPLILQLPVFAGDTDSVPRGAIAALGFNYYDLGRQTGQIVLRVLQGANPGDIPVEGVRITELYVNPGAAAAMGVTIPPDMLQRAKFVVD